jgi:16S rRNA C1402 (ribose-2'-O) methylase RsmI
MLAAGIPLLADPGVGDLAGIVVFVLKAENVQVGILPGI